MLPHDKQTEQIQHYTFTDKDKQTIRDHYLIAALWTHEDDQEFEDLTIHDLDPDDAKTLNEHIDRFIDLSAPFLKSYFQDHNLEQFGHDLYLTTNGHGTGFWDRKYTDPALGDQLSNICRKIGGFDLYATDSNTLGITKVF